MEHIVCLTVEDPHARAKLAERDISHYLTPQFDEPDLLLFTSRALGAIKYTKVHDLWSGVLLGRLSEYSGEVSLYKITDSGFDMDRIRRLASSRGVDLDRYLRSLDEEKIRSLLA